ncbi:MAG TPA: MFS transporter [Candidatus Binatia bacterium]|nr:MFS transporter [Candidatus Binatia bacterium]
MPIFRALFAAQLGSNIGNWMETVGAQWMLVHHPQASTLVALVQTADTLPFMFLALPAGVFADLFDRRRYLMFVHLFLTLTSGLMAVATFAGVLSPSLLLALTFLEGAGTALAAPAWQAIIPELVPRSDLQAAAALGGINMNLARAVGPALAGVIVSRMGPGVVFALNAVTFLFGIAVVFAWRPPPQPATSLARERIVPAVRAGMRYVRHSPAARRLLLRLMLFVSPAVSLWALLPVVASSRLHLGPSGYGVLLGALGVGALIAAVVLPPLRRRLSSGHMVAGASALYAAALLVTGLVTNTAAVLVMLVGAGMAWLAILVHVSASMQLLLPAWVRARGLAIYQLAFMGSQAIPAAIWGAIAQRWGIGPALVGAAIVLAGGAATIRRWPIYETSGLDRSPAIYWPMPTLLVDPDSTDGPVLVTIRYTVSHANSSAFVEAMARVGRSRQRTGAVSWDLFRDGERPTQFVEVFLVSSWEEHHRQHEGRMTGADREFEQRARALAAGPPEVTHLFQAEASLRDEASRSAAIAQTDRA